MGCTGSKKKKTDNSTDENTDEIQPELTDRVVNELLHKTKFSQQDIVDWWHGFLNDCPSGVLDKKKFVEVYQYRYPNGKAKKFCEHVFRTFNPDKKTQVIDFEHFMCAIDITLNGDSDDKLGWAFTMYDINGDQRISKDEMVAVVESMFDLLGKNKKGANNPRLHVDQIFQRIDTDKDNYISKDEFLSGCKTDPQIRTILAPHY
jgi:neurocalcin delta